MTSKTSAGADAVIAAGAAVAGTTWIAQVNDVLQLALTAISIIGVVYAIAWHRARLKDMKRKLDKIAAEVVPDESD